MATTQTQNGKAYEYACILALRDNILPIRPVSIEQSSSVEVAQKSYLSLPPKEQQIMLLSANAGVKTVLRLEPKITEDGKDELVLAVQPDSKGISGDVRDVLILRRSILWEIGLSVKHNHLAAKHSRLSPTIDFGKEWFGLPCSEVYWKELEPIFSYIGNLKRNGKNWNEVSDKIQTIYLPLLKAFMVELQRLDQFNPRVVPERLLEYLIGKEDFYKIISQDSERKTIVQSYNLRGTLNQKGLQKKPDLVVGRLKLPSAIRYIDISESHPDNTADLIMNENWAVSFRIHNASTKVENSLKFNIEITGIPSAIFTHHESW